MDQYHWPVLTVEERFFDQCDMGNGISLFAMVRLFLTVQLQCQLWFFS